MLHLQYIYQYDITNPLLLFFYKHVQVTSVLVGEKKSYKNKVQTNLDTYTLDIYISQLTWIITTTESISVKTRLTTFTLDQIR